MCFYETHTQKSTLPEKKYRLADFFNSHWEEYVKNPNGFIAPEQYKAVNYMRICRTEVLGVDVYACKECGDVGEVYHSCKHRFCPTCSWTDTIKWAEKVKGRMLNAPHRHVVCTVPHSLNGLIKRNQEKVLGILMRTAADTFKDWMLNKHGIKVGIISVLHTFGEKKNFHCHVHMIVSWAGIETENNTLKIVKENYVNYPFIKNKFRIKFEDELIAMFDSNELKHDFINRSDFMKFIKKVNFKDWIVHIEPPMDTPEAVIRYIGRYSKRACLSEYKITNMEGEFISFKYKDNKDRDGKKKAKEKILILHYRDFFPLLLQHVPLPNFKVIRYYGIYSNKGTVSEQYLYKKENEKFDPEGSYESEEYIEDPRICTHCTGDKEYIHTYFDKRKLRDRKTPFNINTDKHLIVKFDIKTGGQRMIIDRYLIVHKYSMEGRNSMEMAA